MSATIAGGQAVESTPPPNASRSTERVTHSVTATYSGDGNFAGSTEAVSGGQVVNPKPQPTNGTFLMQVYEDLLQRPADQPSRADRAERADQGPSAPGVGAQPRQMLPSGLADLEQE